MPRLPFGPVVAVVAVVDGDLAMGQLEDAIGDAIDEVPVVGDGGDGALGFRQQAFQPCFGFEIEVIVGLVEK